MLALIAMLGVPYRHPRVQRRRGERDAVGGLSGGADGTQTLAAPSLPTDCRPVAAETAG